MGISAVPQSAHTGAKGARECPETGTRAERRRPVPQRCGDQGSALAGRIREIARRTKVDVGEQAPPGQDAVESRQALKQCGFGHPQFGLHHLERPAAGSGRTLEVVDERLGHGAKREAKVEPDSEFPILGEGLLSFAETAEIQKGIAPNHVRTCRAETVPVAKAACDLRRVGKEIDLAFAVRVIARACAAKRRFRSAFESGALAFKLLRQPFIILVQKGHPSGSKRSYSAISRRAGAGVCLSDTPQTASKAGYDIKRPIRGAVIDDNDLVGWPALRQHAFDGAAQAMGIVVGRNDGPDRENRFVPCHWVYSNLNQVYPSPARHECWKVSTGKAARQADGGLQRERRRRRLPPPVPDKLMVIMGNAQSSNGGPAIAVVIPLYKGAQFIRAALDSILSQSVPASEIVVVDDGSPDDSGAIASSYGERVRVIRQENAGAAVARNRGLAECRSDWIAFLDQDDLCETDRLLRTREAILKHPSALWVYSDYTRHDAMTGERRYVRTPGPEEYARLVRFKCHVMPSFSTINRRALTELGGFDSSPELKGGDDWVLAMRFMRRYGSASFVHVPEALTTYTVHDGNVSGDPTVFYRGRVLILNDQLDGYRGLARFIWKRIFQASIHFDKSVHLREASKPGYLAEMLKSMAQWPLPNRLNLPATRYRILAHMVLSSAGILRARRTAP